MKTLLCSIGLAAGLAGAATAITAPGSEAWSRAAQPSTQVQVNRTARADRLPVGVPASVRVKTIVVRPVEARREQRAPGNPAGCEAVVSPLADLAASRQLRQCMT
jgi:hypothetical protein